jgi:hypothetical protein
LVVIPTLVLIVFITGLDKHRSLYLNSLISATILSIVFIAFITTGLYNGWKLKDTIGKFNLKFRRSKRPDLSNIDAPSLDIPDGGEHGIVVILVALLLWIVVAIFGSFILTFVGGLLWLTLLSIAAILYWIIFRAFRLIFKNSTNCRGRIFKSLGIAIVYTVLYNFWIYGIILGTHFLKSQ